MTAAEYREQLRVLCATYMKTRGKLPKHDPKINKLSERIIEATFSEKLGAVPLVFIHTRTITPYTGDRLLPALLHPAMVIPGNPQGLAQAVASGDQASIYKLGRQAGGFVLAWTGPKPDDIF